MPDGDITSSGFYCRVEGGTTTVPAEVCLSAMIQDLCEEPPPQISVRTHFSPQLTRSLSDNSFSVVFPKLVCKVFPKWADALSCDYLWLFFSRRKFLRTAHSLF